MFAACIESKACQLITRAQGVHEVKQVIMDLLWKFLMDTLSVQFLVHELANLSPWTNFDWQYFRIIWYLSDQ